MQEDVTSNLIASAGVTTTDQRIASFGRALEALRREVEAKIGEEDARHIERIAALSRRLEILGRGLIHFGFEPISLGLGTAALFVHKSLHLMEIGHPALHGSYDGLRGAERFSAEKFRWQAPIDEASWRTGHNLRHHQFTNIEGQDPDLNFGALRLSARVSHQRFHALQPITNLLSWLGFGTALSLHVSGMLDVYLKRGEPETLADREPATVRSAQRAFLTKFLRHYAREYIFFPALAGPFFFKVLLCNAASELARDCFAAAIIYCGHVGATDYPRGTRPAGRAQWYVMQVEGTRDVEMPEFLSIMTGALNRQIEHHLFPRLPPNRLREIAPRVRDICNAHGVTYRTGSWGSTLRSVLRTLTELSSPQASPEPSLSTSAA